MPTSSSVRLPLIAALAFLVTPLLAHHSFGAIFDVNQPLTLTGTVTKIEWTNPHRRTSRPRWRDARRTSSARRRDG